MIFDQVDEEKLREEFADQTECVRQKIELCRTGHEERSSIADWEILQIMKMIDD